MERDRNAVGGKEDTDDREPGDIATDLRQEHLHQIVLRPREDDAALLRLGPELLHPSPEDADQQPDEHEASNDNRRGQEQMLGDVSELAIERAGDGKEEVEVDEGADHCEEDLVYEVSRQDPRERRARHDRDEHEEHDERPHVGGQHAVQSGRDRIRGHDRSYSNTRLRIGRSQDVNPGERVERRLYRLEEAPGDEITDRDLGHRVPDRVQPAPDRDTKQVADEQEERQAAEPQPDPRQSMPERHLRSRGRDQALLIIPCAGSPRISTASVVSGTRSVWTTTVSPKKSCSPRRRSLKSTGRKPANRGTMARPRPMSRSSARPSRGGSPEEP